MTLPAPVLLDPPPGDPAALADLVSAVTGAAFGAGVLTAHLTGPATSAPSWLGADAAAAAEQVGAVAGLAEQLHGTLTAAEQRLRVHADVLDEARRRITALRRAQAEDFAEVSARLVTLADPDAAGPSIEALEAAEGDRRRAHAAAVAEVTTDAALTAQVLADTTTGLGGTGERGQAGRVRARLAALLPGWGNGELIARAWAAARALDGPVTAEDIDRIAREGLPYAGSSAYAGALLANLGEDGVRWLLVELGQEGKPSAVLARWLATAFGAAHRPASEKGALSDVLDARYVDPDSVDGVADQVVFGLTTLLTAVPVSTGGVRSETAATWGVQMLARERQLGVAAADRLRSYSLDPVDVVVDRLAASADPAAAAALLGSREAWDALLARTWDDGAVALGALVHDAAAGPTGDAAVRSGLEALGTGLSPLADGVSWTVDRTTAAQISPILGDAVAVHAGVATDLLAAAGTGAHLVPADDAALRGLGYLTLDADAAAAVQSAVDTRTAVVDLAGTDPSAPAHAVAVRSALVAAREYAQRLEHAIDGYVALSDAVDRQFTYDVMIRMPVRVVSIATEILPGDHVVPEVFESLVDAGAWLLNADGSWELGPDEGLVFDREDAAAAVAPLAQAADPATAEQVSRQARAAFDRTLRLLGHPEPPAPQSLLEYLPADRAELKFGQLERVAEHR